MSLPWVGATTAVEHELCQGENTKCKSCSIECLEQNAATSAHLWSQGHKMRAYLACPTHPCIRLWVRIQKEMICEYSCATKSCMCYVRTKPKLYQSQKKRVGGGGCAPLGYCLSWVQHNLSINIVPKWPWPWRVNGLWQKSDKGYLPWWRTQTQPKQVSMGDGGEILSLQTYNVPVGAGKHSKLHSEPKHRLGRVQAVGAYISDACWILWRYSSYSSRGEQRGAIVRCCVLVEVRREGWRLECRQQGATSWNVRVKLKVKLEPTGDTVTRDAWRNWWLDDSTFNLQALAGRACLYIAAVPHWHRCPSHFLLHIVSSPITSVFTRILPLVLASHPAAPLAPTPAKLHRLHNAPQLEHCRWTTCSAPETFMVPFHSRNSTRLVKRLV